MSFRAARPPVWLLGFGMWPLGVNAALLLITMPQLLAAERVAVGRIAAITSMALAPGFVSFLIAPLLDWRLPRRTWAIVFTLVTAAGSMAAFALSLRPEFLAPCFFVSNLGAYLVSSACGGWFGELVAPEEQGRLGAWFAAVNIGGGGLAAAIAIPVVRALPHPLGGVLLAATSLLVIPLFLATPCPPADDRLATERFAGFVRDVGGILRSPAVRWTLLLFLSPATAFALTNSLAGFAGDFAIGETAAGLTGGIGVTLAGIVGSLLVPAIGARIEGRALFLLIGVVGGGFTLLLIAAPRTPALFGLALLGENVLQAAAFAVSNLLTLRTLGRDNPLAATQFGLLFASSSVPLTYMQVADGAAFATWGLDGGLLVDGVFTGASSIALACVFHRFRARVARADRALA